MAIIFDPTKNARKIDQRGISFALIAQLAWDRALVIEDVRKDYGETRLIVMAPMRGRLYVAVVTPRGNDLRVISFRKANTKEIGRYDRPKICSG
jgi:uncharacterized DUF497 family protein